VQAMPQGGPLTISAHREGNVVVAEITDRGVGIPEEMHEKIFELYFTTKKEGSGIGLARTYQILQWHYGSVEFESHESEGTIFRFRIPVSPAMLESERENAVPFEPAFTKPHL
jgi:signal transduction histidine kinase